MSDQAVLLPKCFSHRGIILAKGQFDHSYIFLTMANYDIQPSSKFYATVSNKHLSEIATSSVVENPFSHTLKSCTKCAE